MMPNFNLPFEGVFWLALSEGSGDLVFPLRLMVGLLPPIIPNFEAGTLVFAFLEVMEPGSGSGLDSESDSVEISVDADDSFLESVTDLLGDEDGDADSGSVTGRGLLFVCPRVPSFGAR